MEICGLARAVEPDLERCYDAVRHAPLHRIHTFLATSDLHLDVKVRNSTPPPAPGCPPPMSAATSGSLRA